jgi:crossover junction endodeoxyribonuclease RusA
MIGFELPFPPSVNHTWMRGKGNRLYSCAKVKDFHKLAALLISDAKNTFNTVEFPIKGRLRVVITLNEKDKRSRDLDNYNKSAMDACTKNGLWEDDSQIDELIIRRGVIDKENPNVFIHIEGMTHV